MEHNFSQRWNERYSGTDYAYGKTPNDFLAKNLPDFSPGKILFPAEGEGRNAVFAASLGWDATAFDISAAGRNKALQLAADHKLSIQYLIGELPELPLLPNQYDALALIYAHFPADIKRQYHRTLATLLKSGAVVIFEAFSKNHLSYIQRDERIGGPKDLASLFSIEEIAEDFSDFDVLLLTETEIELHEGLYHNGLGSVIRFIGFKK